MQAPFGSKNTVKWRIFSFTVPASEDNAFEGNTSLTIKNQIKDSII